MFLGNSSCFEPTSYINEVGQRVVRNLDTCLQSNLMNQGYSEAEAREAATTFTYGPMPQGEAPGYSTGAPAGYVPAPVPAPPPAPFNPYNPSGNPIYNAPPAPGPSMWFPVAPTPVAPGPVSLPAPPLGPLTMDVPSILPVEPGGELTNSGSADAPVFTTGSGGGSTPVLTQETGGFPWLLAAAAAALLLL